MSLSSVLYDKVAFCSSLRTELELSKLFCLRVILLLTVTLFVSSTIYYNRLNPGHPVRHLISRASNMTSWIKITDDSDYVVPNIVHFIWFMPNSSWPKQMSFINYLSILSVHKIHKPETIYLHCNITPTGAWWEALKQEVNLTVLHREAPVEIFGQRLAHLYHVGDVAKLEILMEYGGIYLDYDVLVVNSLDPLRKYDITLGKEKPPKFIAGIIIAKKNSEFLRLWYDSYRNDYKPNDWDYNCAQKTYKLYLQRPELVHVEFHKLTTPDYSEIMDLYYKVVIDWHDLYLVHLMAQSRYPHYTPDGIKRMNSTLGQVMRYIYYGKWDLIM